MELAAAGGEDRGGHGPLEQALHGGHQHRTVPPVEPGQNFQALVLPLAGGGPGVKEEVPGGENRHLRPGEGAEVSRQTPGLSVVGHTRVRGRPVDWWRAAAR